MILHYSGSVGARKISLRKVLTTSAKKEKKNELCYWDVMWLSSQNAFFFFLETLMFNV